MSNPSQTETAPDDVSVPHPSFPMPSLARERRMSQELPPLGLGLGLDTGSINGASPAPAQVPLSPFNTFPSPLLPMPSVRSDIKTDCYMGVEVITGAVPPTYRGYRPKNDIEEVYRSCAGLGTRNTRLVRALAPLSATSMQVLQSQYMAVRQKELVDLLRKESSGIYKAGLTLLASGPLAGDAFLLRQAEKPKNSDIRLQILTDLIVARPKSDIVLLTQYVAATMHGNLRRMVMDMIPARLTLVRDIFERCFELDVPQYQGSDFEEDVKVLNSFFAGNTKSQETEKVIEMFIHRPARDLNRLCRFWQENNFGESLAKTIKRCVADEAAASVLMYAVRAAETEPYMGNYDLGVWRDAQRIEDAITSGKNYLLTYRIIRAHWDGQRFAAVVAAYNDIKAGKTPLVSRIKGATTGNLETLLKEVVQVADSSRTIS